MTTKISSSNTEPASEVGNNDLRCICYDACLTAVFAKMQHETIYFLTARSTKWVLESIGCHARHFFSERSPEDQGLSTASRTTRNDSVLVRTTHTNDKNAPGS
jgi:hypothetical protein